MPNIRYKEIYIDTSVYHRYKIINMYTSNNSVISGRIHIYLIH